MDFSPIDTLMENVQYHIVCAEYAPSFTELTFLRALLMDPPPECVEDGTLHDFEHLVTKAGALISSFDLTKFNRSMAYDLDHAFYTPLKLIWPWMAMSYNTYYDEYENRLNVNFPRTGQIGFLDHLVENLQVLVKVKPVLISPSKVYILKLGWKLQAVSCSLKQIPEARKDEADLKDLMLSVTLLAYQVEYAIDSYLVGYHNIRHLMYRLRDILLKLEGRVTQVNMENGDVRSIVSRIIEDRGQEELDLIPIIQDDKIIEKLRKIINDRRISVEFPVRTWSLVSSYKEREKEVLRELLVNVTFRPYLVDTSGLVTSENKLEKSLYELLYNKRYFILLEDVRDIEALNNIRKVLPENRNRSRILFTTRSPQLVVKCRYGFPKSLNEISEDHSQTKKPITTQGDVVGFKAETDKMYERLTGEPKELHIISIAGMAGKGKTTFAKKLYHDLSIASYFRPRAWCCVSQVYTKKELLLELLGQIVQIDDTIRHTNDEELAAMLCKNLRGNRFLILLDDMWSIGAWNDLRRCFPNDKNGSRVIITTRLQKLASEAQIGYVLQPLEPLSNAESWTLLQKKLFKNESCPNELLGVGMEIAKYCKGLPLSVVLTAGLLAKMEKRKDVWKDIAESLSSRILGDADAEDKGVIELSYKHLPDFLKPCFLYFGAFIEDREVPVQKLVRLWIAEGFINDCDSKILEDVANSYLKDLIDRSLVIVANEKSSGGVKSCRVHDLLREFALTKAREENFLQPIHGYDEHFPFGSAEPGSVTYYQRRLCIYSKRDHFFTLKPFGPLVRSLLFFASDIPPSYSYDISFVFHNYKLLRILNFEDINIGHSFGEIDVLLHLRYLAVQGTMVSVPSSIANLLNLETFCVKSLENEVVEVSDSIWKLEKLRHLHINGRASFELERDRLENFSVQDNLQTFSTPSLAYGDDMEKLLRKLRYIRKLKCIFLDSWDDATNCNQFPVLEFLEELESLKVFYCGERRYPCQFNFPANLKKLTLINFRMPWSEISQLATLDNLEVLKLQGNAFTGEIWEMEDEVVFPKLKFLKLDTLDVVEWIAARENFPRLQCLLLHKCEQLSEIPPGIGDIPTLLMLEVKWCSPSATISATKIQEEQLEFGNDGLIFNVVHPEVWDSGPSL